MVKKNYSALLLCTFLTFNQPIKADISPKTVVACTTLGTLAFGGLTIPNWWNLGLRLDELQMRKKVGTLTERNSWVSPYDFKTGHALWAFYTSLNTKQEKDAFKQQLLEEVCSAESIDRHSPEVGRLVHDALNRSLAMLQNELNEYANYSPVMLELARSIGFSKNPQELITSDYIIDYNISRHDLPLQKALSHYLQHKSYLPIMVKYTWSPTFGTRIPYCFTWTHKKAAECVFEILQQYARIRAIQRVMEQYLSPHNQVQDINLNLNHTPPLPSAPPASLFYQDVPPAYSK